MSDDMGGKYFGVYPATVVQNVDPELRGRLQLSIPDVHSYVPTTFAEPCALLAGPSGPPMGVYSVPPPGTGVWVMFKYGDADKPVWMGCRWGETPATSGVPTLALAGNPADPNFCIQSFLQHTFMISDMPPSPLTGGIILKSTTGAMIVVNDSGIYINNGKGASINMIGPMINFNLGAMQIT